MDALEGKREIGLQNPLERLKATENLESEFPPLNLWRSGTDKAAPLTIESTPMGSWKDKVISANTKPGMQLKFVPPIIENGELVVHIETLDLENLSTVWENYVVLYVVGENTRVDIIRGFIRKYWHHVRMPNIHPHKDGYFILKFSSENECNSILTGGPYFLNKAPIVVKKWNTEFDFKAEILRVIPVWVRLPSLPFTMLGRRNSK